LLLVSHDRDFIDNVVTSTMVMEGDGVIGEYVGGYSDWVRQRPAAPGSAAAVAKASATAVPAAPAQPAAAEAASAPARRKLSYKDARELEQLPGRIEALETEPASLAAAMSDPAFYQQDPGAVAAHGKRMGDAQAELDAAYARWSELDG